ncbi:hypothetical protein GYMLUDRAFT_394125 [Collybiopsis luxurians FD-317 M1]|uniref:Uncharacterized protein n=1 Tax=Collybiopsis luxurians FD-317 M1 TaxID=944289 RepID=A0A0D0AMS1_9AGAR|nr:hypothetical protein GYMLUDRAFT_394125 [Collybiopsis luxurians FD-317 M1]
MEKNAAELMQQEDVVVMSLKEKNHLLLKQLEEYPTREASIIQENLIVHTHISKLIQLFRVAKRILLQIESLM